MNTELKEQDSTPSPAVLTVSALNQSVARLLEKNFPLTWISGEVSNFTRAASGHWYFTLKDDSAQVRAVMFRGRTQSVGFEIKNGDRIEARATVTLYPARGEYQLNVEAIRHAGIGNLFEAFLRLKEKLAKQGLFDAERKQALPSFPRTIGIVTSLQAAALRDVLTTLSRRAPHIRIILYPTPVQGEGAGEKIAEAIQTASSRAEVDMLIVCRGGGSIEDLWSFNEEVVALAIVACTIPVISGVGHETDTTITDFVADIRAPTPTGAAEMATRSQAEWLNQVRTEAEDLRYAMARIMANAQQSVDIASRRLISPATYTKREKIRLQGLSTQLTSAGKRMVSDAKNQLAHLQTRLKGQLPDTLPHHTFLRTSQRQMSTFIASSMINRHQAITSLKAQLELLSPERTLERGYAIITDKKGRVIRTPSKLPIRETVTIRLAQGSAQVGIASVQPEIE